MPWTINGFNSYGDSFDNEQWNSCDLTKQLRFFEGSTSNSTIFSSSKTSIGFILESPFYINYKLIFSSKLQRSIISNTLVGFEILVDAGLAYVVKCSEFYMEIAEAKIQCSSIWRKAFSRFPMS